MGKALIAMSGGVDSSVAVRLMQEQGEECVGVTMSLFPKSAGVDDTAAARDVAKRLGVPFYVADYQDEFEYLISAGIALNVQAISTPVFPLI